MNIRVIIASLVLPILLGCGIKDLHAQNILGIGSKQIFLENQTTSAPAVQIYYGRSLTEKLVAEISTSFGFSTSSTVKTMVDIKLCRLSKMGTTNIHLGPNLNFTYMFGRFINRSTLPNLTGRQHCQKSLAVGVSPGLTIMYKGDRFSFPLSINGGWYNAFGKHVSEQECQQAMNAFNDSQIIGRGILVGMNLGVNYIFNK